MATQWTAGLTSGGTLSANTLNTIGAAWETYTPSPIQGGYLTGFVTNYSKYARFQKTCIVTQKITFTSAAGAIGGQAILANLPFPAAGGTAVTGSFYYFQAGIANYVGACTGYPGLTSYVQLVVSQLGAVGVSPGFVPANTHFMQISLSYETT